MLLIAALVPSAIAVGIFLGTFRLVRPGAKERVVILGATPGRRA